MYSQPQDLVGYIDSQLSYGVATAYIRQVLLQAGWPLPIVDNSLNQELAHTAHMLPIPLDANAYYSQAAPQYYSVQQGATPTYWQPAPSAYTSHFFVVCSLAIFRFAVMSVLVTLIILGPIIFGSGWLFFITVTSGTFGINSLGPYVVVCILAWIIIALIRLMPAPFVAAVRQDIPLRRILGSCWR